MTISVDNASSNDKALSYLAKMLPKMYDEGRHFQIRCVAHVLNFIVKDGLDECNYSVDTVRNAIRYIKLSTQRIKKFKDCIKDSRVTTNCFLIGDCLTRWNSTHDMLKVACELKKAFELYDVGNSSFSSDLDKVPNTTDFKVCGDLETITYRITKKKPLTKSAIDAMVEKMIEEVKYRMGVLFGMYNERERMEINVDEIEDLLNDDEVVKEMEEALRSYKGKQVMES
nr:zinc finger BED domain-containing protein RICESLEEPER 2 [Tanacetum cinerariifolium]